MMIITIFMIVIQEIELKFQGENDQVLLSYDKNLNDDEDQDEIKDDNEMVIEEDKVEEEYTNNKTKRKLNNDNKNSKEHKQKSNKVDLMNTETIEKTEQEFQKSSKLFDANHNELNDSDSEHNGNDDDNNSNKADNKKIFEEIYFEKFKSTFVFIHHNQFNEVYDVMEYVQPSYVVLYDPEISIIRNIETYQSNNKSRLLFPIKVYFLMYENSVEEHRYKATLAKERKAFNLLIQSKANMVINLPDLDKEAEIKNEEVILYDYYYDYYSYIYYYYSYIYYKLSQVVTSH